MGPEAPRPPRRGPRYWRVPRPRRAWPALLGWLAFLVLGFVALGLTAATMVLEDTLELAVPDTKAGREARGAVAPVLPGQDAWNILLLGSDVRPEDGDANGRSDTLMLVRVDQRNQFISTFSLPRDLLVDIPGHGRDKITHAYFYSTKTAIDTVKNLIKQDIHYYVRVDFQAFATLVNELGGVFIDVDRHYFNENRKTIETDFAPINIDAGYQKLNGNDALDFVRFRHTDGVGLRGQRQQLFMTEVKRQMRDAGPVKNLGAVQKMLGSGVEMNITDSRTFLRLMDLALRTPSERVVRVPEMPTTPELDPNLGWVDHYTEEDLAASLGAWLEPEFAEQKPVAGTGTRGPGSLRVAVLNGSRRIGDAAAMADLLRARRYKAEITGNSDSHFDQTTVYWAPGMKNAALRLRNQIGPDTGLRVLDARQARGNDLVVVVGTDFDGAFTPAKPTRTTRDPANVVHTTSLVQAMKDLQSEVPFDLMVPTAVAADSEVRIVRSYRTGIRGRDGAPAVKIVFRSRAGNNAGQYWGIMLTTTPEPGILRGPTGADTFGDKRRYRTYYDGRSLQRVAFRQNGVTVWVSNTLTNELSAKTMEEIVKSIRPLPRARLAKGVTDTPIQVQTESHTP